MFGAKGRQGQVKGHKHQLLNPQGFQQLQLLLRQVEPQARFTGQHLAGVGPEGKHRGHQGFTAGRHRSSDHPAVAGVNTIKTAQGHGRWRLGLLGGAQVNQ